MPRSTYYRDTTETMDKGTWIAIGIAALLGVVYFVTSESPQSTDEGPYTVDTVKSLERIEIRPPAGEEGQSGDSEEKAQSDDQKAADEDADDEQRPSLIAFERREDGWWLTQPVDAPVGESTAKRFDEAFSLGIETDDLEIPTENPGKYKLDAAGAVKVSLFGEGATTSAAEFMVGKEMKVDKTNVKRTFIQPVDGEKIYRAQAAFGELVRKSVDEYRSDQIIGVDREKVSKLVVDRADGMTIELVEEIPEGGGDTSKLPSRRGSWKLKNPTVDWDVDQREVRSAVGVLTDLSAKDFADDLSKADAGLDEPESIVKVTEGDTTHEVMIGVVDSQTESADGGQQAEPTYYAKLPGERFIYELESYAGDKLDMTLGEIRSKTPRRFRAGIVTRMAFPGGDAVVVGRTDDGGWTLERPEADKEFNEKKFETFRQNALELTVDGFPDAEPGEVGLDRGSEEVRIERSKQPTVRILIGERTGDGGRYVRFDDDDEVYTIDGSTYDQLTVEVDQIVGEIEQQGRGKMPGGMGGPGTKRPGGGGGLSPGQKQKIMRQLKQKMGNR